MKAPPHRSAGQTSPVQDRLRTRRSWCWTRRIVARSERRSPMGAAISVSGCRPGPISCMCKWSIFLGVRRLKRPCAGITLPSHASTATRGFGELARNDNRGAKLIRPQASRVVAIARTLRQRPCCARSFKRNTHREMQKLAKALHSAVRALSVSAYNRGGMWHVSALYRPCIGHRTGYSSQGMREMPGFSGLASAWRPRLFLRALRKEPSLRRAAPFFRAGEPEECQCGVPDGRSRAGGATGRGSAVCTANKSLGRLVNLAEGVSGH